MRGDECPKCGTAVGGRTERKEVGGETKRVFFCENCENRWVVAIEEP